MVIMNGKDRLRIFFQPKGIAHTYWKNLRIIGEKDYNEMIHYEEWLLNVELPKIKDRIEEALINEFQSKEDLDYHIWDLKESFRKYEELIKKEKNELEFLKAYNELEFLKAYS